MDLTKFDAVLFDLDSTLTNTQNYPIEASEWLLKQLTEDTSEILAPYVRSLFGYYRAGIDEIAAGGVYRSPADIIRKAVLQSLDEIGLKIETDTLDNALEVFKQLHIDRSIPAHGVENLLRKIKKHSLRMGVFTNSFQGNAEIILRRHALADFFEVIADGSDIPAFKPMKEAFYFMAEKMNVPTSSCIYVGDEYYSDIVGATSAGMSAVWINKRGRSLEENLKRYGQETNPILVLDSILDLSNFYP
ncbi:MAG: HAD family hydrolase [Candidatus Thorarchaeota archaeon]|nr:MAG: HAD family hydrolase [Candidatus Thorarchaeota archaeon]